MTARHVPDVVGALTPFVEAGVLGTTEVQVTATLARAAAPEVLHPDVLLAIALAVRGPQHGHVCVDLSTVASSVVPHDDPGPSDGAGPDRAAGADEDPDDPSDEWSAFAVLDDGTGPGGTDDGTGAASPAPPLRWPDPAGWAGRVLSSGLARREEDPPGSRRQPVVVRGDSVYLDRYWQDECLVAADLRARAAVDLAADPGAGAALDALFPLDDQGPDAQRSAAEAALRHQLVVIAGGPGTGKTRTVARLLAVLQGRGGLQEREAGESADGAGRPLEIVLAAPTGKAAARVSEAVRREVAETDLEPEVAGRLSALEARTVHRLLGFRSGGASFRHDASNPLTADVVVVDEVSMVSLPLMARLLDAVRPEARVVLVGDPYQLASVEAGAVLGDVVGTRDGAAPAALAANVVTLDRVYRFDEGSAIGILARAINQGDADAVIDLLRHGPAGTGAAVQWIRPEDDATVAGVTDQVVAHAADLVDVARAGDAATALGLVGRLKVLCATRRGQLGVEDWNRTVERRLRATGRMRSRWSAGRPVMVTANDYLNGVFNGDVGVVVRADPVRAAATGAGARARRVQVAFEAGGEPRRLDTSRLDRVETQWAMTIHKSQGSEFDHVVVTLPPPPSPILTRELLYTAVTRARHRVTLVATEDAVRAAVARPVARASGLADRLS